MTTISPPELAKRYGCKPSRVIAWIRSGELVALNLASPGCARPRYRITPEAITAFEQAKSTAPPPPKKSKRYRSPVTVREFF